MHILWRPTQIGGNYNENFNACCKRPYVGMQITQNWLVGVLKIKIQQIYSQAKIQVQPSAWYK